MAAVCQLMMKQVMQQVPLGREHLDLNFTEPLDFSAIEDFFRRECMPCNISQSLCVNFYRPRMSRKSQIRKVMLMVKWKLIRLIAE